MVVVAKVSLSEQATPCPKALRRPPFMAAQGWCLKLLVAQVRGYAPPPQLTANKRARARARARELDAVARPSHAAESVPDSGRLAVMNTDADGPHAVRQLDTRHNLRPSARPITSSHLLIRLSSSAPSSWRREPSRAEGRRPWGEGAVAIGRPNPFLPTQQGVAHLDLRPDRAVSLALVLCG
jgi:hypothetical protein